MMRSCAFFTDAMAESACISTRSKLLVLNARCDCAEVASMHGAANTAERGDAGVERPEERNKIGRRAARESVLHTIIFRPRPLLAAPLHGLGPQQA